MKVAVSALQPGDVIRTNPDDGYWGCAIVLDRFSLSPMFPKSEASHIATTGLVKKSLYELVDIDMSDLKPLLFEQHYQPTEDSPLYIKTVTCVEKYALLGKHKVDVIGTTDPLQIYGGPLCATFGDFPGGFPLRMHIDRYLGNEALITWRRKCDKDAWDAMVAKSNAANFDLEKERLQKNHETRKPRTRE
ncbi:hypothetical protein [Polaromonas aquatica]|uniref:hypothetical protein n=1 Tax=Polaromonas aquatica TaxID=332657 RepID=UPI003D64E193